MGLSRNEFWQLTWGEYQAKCYGLTYKEEVQWIYTRYMVAMNLNIHIPKGKNPIKPEELIHLSLFDKKVKDIIQEIPTWTKEQLLEIKYRQGMIPRPKKEEITQPDI